MSASTMTNNEVRRKVRQVHDTLQREHGVNVTVHMIQDALADKGVRITEDEIVQALNDTNPIRGRNAQGWSNKAHAAHVAALDAFEASRQARVSDDDPDAHEVARAKHEIAARAAKASHEYHLRACAYHAARVRGESAETPFDDANEALNAE